jgi:hypothetical protein
MTQARALRIALLCTGACVLAATFLLIEETANNFVLFMFLGPPLLLIAAAALGWVIWQDLRARKVL